ncbi:hypothetical protein D3C85_1560810 [compost metagenome]
MITDAELLELEMLLIDKYENHVFKKILYNEMTNEIIAFFEDLEYLLVEYSGRYRVFSTKVIMSLDLFNLLKMRYFPANETVSITTLKMYN